MFITFKYKLCKLGVTINYHSVYTSTPVSRCIKYVVLGKSGRCTVGMLVVFLYAYIYYIRLMSCPV